MLTHTQLELARAAERLFAQRGVDAPTLLEVATAAGQRNRGAVQYHFGDRRELVEAILERHSSVVQNSWIEPLAMLRREGLLTIERVVRLMVSSLVRRSQHEDGGAAYIQICRQLLVHPSIPLMSTRMVQSEGALRMAEAIRETAPPPRGFEVLWPMRLAHVLFHSIGDYQLHAATCGLSQSVFEDELARGIVAWLSATSTTPARAT